MSGAGAARLAQTIKSFWSAAGFEVSIDIVPFAAGKGTSYALRSSMIGGLPRAPTND
jgi:hypothetical protein